MNEITKYEAGALANFEETAMTVEGVVKQIALIQNVMSSVMKKDEHFGVIPGCGNKPSLLKAGAEKLAMTFRLAPEYSIQIVPYDGGHREYQVKCMLRHIPSGNYVGEGHGICSTMEGKFRFRSENTGRPVPKEYWDTKNPAVLGGSTFKARKVDKSWFIFQEVEHPNPADYYNTCEKMGLKRAFVHAILTSTAASDIFTQDIEDMPEVITSTLVEDEPRGVKKISQDQVTMFMSRMSTLGLNNTQVHAYLKDFGYASVKDIPSAEVDRIMASITEKAQDTPETFEAEVEPPPDDNAVLVPFGDYKGKPLSSLPDKDVASMIKYFSGNGNKKPDPKYADKNAIMLNALEAERERRIG